MKWTKLIMAPTWIVIRWDVGRKERPIRTSPLSNAWGLFSGRLMRCCPPADDVTAAASAWSVTSGRVTSSAKSTRQRPNSLRPSSLSSSSTVAISWQSCLRAVSFIIHELVSTIPSVTQSKRDARAVTILIARWWVVVFIFSTNAEAIDFVRETK